MFYVYFNGLSYGVMPIEVALLNNVTVDDTPPLAYEEAVEYAAELNAAP